MTKIKDAKPSKAIHKKNPKKISSPSREFWANFNPETATPEQFHPDIILSSSLTRRLFESEDERTLQDYLDEYILVNQYIGLQIYSLRTMKMLTQAELARKLGISNDEIFKYERGDELIPVEVIIKAVDFFELDLDCFFANYDLFKMSVFPCLQTKAILKAREFKDLNILCSYAWGMREYYNKYLAKGLKKNV